MEHPEGYLFFTTTMGDVYLIEQDKYEEEIAAYNLAMEVGGEAGVEHFISGNSGWLYAPKVTE